MVNASNIMENNFNLTKIFTRDPIENPTKWFGAFNELMSGYFTITVLTVVGGVLFLLMRNNPNTSDTEAVVYSGLVCSVVGLLLFLADIMTGNTTKLITWTQLMPFMVITAGYPM